VASPDARNSDARTFGSSCSRPIKEKVPANPIEALAPGLPPAQPLRRCQMSTDSMNGCAARFKPMVRVCQGIYEGRWTQLVPDPGLLDATDERYPHHDV
jgi:hypothetical protein